MEKIGSRSMSPQHAIVAFDGDRRIAIGSPPEVVRAAKELLDRRTDASILIFDGLTGGPIDIDFRGSISEVLARLPKTPGSTTTVEAVAPFAPRGPGRPKLGVVAREVTLLPRHWEWLAQQRGGASVALRRLVEEACRTDDGDDRVRRAKDATYRFMSAIAGDKPRYEEAIRALFANRPAHFRELIAEWPADVRDYTLTLAERAFRDQATTGSG
jgi:uncharacterized protein